MLFRKSKNAEPAISSTLDFFSEEVVANIKLREVILGGVFFILFVMTILNIIFIKHRDASTPALVDAFTIYVMLIAFVVLRSVGMRRVIEKHKETVKKHISKIRFVNTFIEGSLPTLAIVLLSIYIDPNVLMRSPLVLLYFVFILVSILDLDFKACVFMGIVTSLEYLILAKIYSAPFNDQNNFLESVFPVAFMSEALIMLLCGIAAAYISRHIKTKVLESIKNLDDRNQLEKVFGQQVSKEIVDEFIKNQMKIENRKREACIMFLDIRDFSKYCEDKSPEEINNYQNGTLGFMIDIVNKHNGIVNQILGDGFMATFGAPISRETFCLDAVTASLEIITALKEKNERNEIPITRVGIGLHAGEIITGNVGASDRKQYSVIGNAVIMSARLEQMNKELGTSVIVSKNVVDKINGQVKFQSLRQISLKGFSEPVEVFTINF